MLLFLCQSTTTLCQRRSFLRRGGAINSVAVAYSNPFPMAYLRRHMHLRNRTKRARRNENSSRRRMAAISLRPSVPIIYQLPIVKMTTVQSVRTEPWYTDDRSFLQGYMLFLSEFRAGRDCPRSFCSAGKGNGGLRRAPFLRPEKSLFCTITG